MARKSADEVLQEIKGGGSRRSADEVLRELSGNTEAKPISGDLFSVDISNPRGDQYGTQILKGAAIGLRMGGKGLKGLFTDLSPDDIAEIDRMKRYQEEAGWPATLGRTIEEIPQYAAMAGAGPATMLGRGGAAALTGGLLSPEDRVTNAVKSGLGSIVGEGVMSGAGARLAHPFGQAKDYVQGLWDKGVRPTWAQALGDGFKQAEEKMTGIPLIGSSINRAHTRTKESFNTASLRDIIDELNTGVNAGAGTNVVPHGVTTLRQPYTQYGHLEPGAEGIESVRGKVGDIYKDLARNSSGEVTPALENAFTTISNMAGQISPDAQRLFDAHLQDVVLSRIKPGQRIPGETIKQIDHDLNALIKNLENPNKSSTDNMLAKAFKEVRQQMIGMMDQQNPGYAPIHRNADAAWNKLALLGKASTSSVADDMATPANLLQAIRALDTSNWKQQFATDSMPWSGWARDNLDLMGNKFPDSGTAARSAINSLAGGGAAAYFGHIPEAVATYMAGRAAWSPMVQNWLVQQSMRQPGPARAGLARVISNNAPLGAAPGAAFAHSR